MKISIILGTRPEGIKLAPVILELMKAPDIECHVCVTGQHREMLDQVLEVFGIIPNGNLQLMEHNQTLAGFTARAIEAINDSLRDDKPDLVLLQGDTTTAFSAALAAFYNHIPTAHVEAGLRTLDMKSPWPEEANRVLVSRLAHLHFAPTQSARQNLLQEGISDKRITVTGNSVIDALFIALEKVKKNRPITPGLPNFLQSAGQNKTNSPNIVLITGHRRESFGQGFKNICLAIAELAKRFSNHHFVYPVHLNPHVRRPVMQMLGETNMLEKKSHTDRKVERNICMSNIHLIEPLSYLEFVDLMDRSILILTDSGGIQEEAPSLGKPVILMREKTERPEAVKAGTVRLAGTNVDDIVKEVSHLLLDRVAYQEMSKAHNPYGDGMAAKRIVKVCKESLSHEQKCRPT
ncbi:MAG: UDP-N-acetylglucosamine 2-epimerase (non-hydrolyzing) [Desulfobacterales bacterium]|nr:UDP-N-acetylglucosamine 2-epimerase (non-hydrolyzing) [Desulfobacterales bacterium]